MDVWFLSLCVAYRDSKYQEMKMKLSCSASSLLLLLLLESCQVVRAAEFYAYFIQAAGTEGVFVNPYKNIPIC